MQVARVIDRFLTGFGWRPHCFSEATATSVISKYAVVAALRPVNPTAADSLAASVAGALLNVVTELVTQMTSAVQSDSTASVLPFMGKSVLGSLSSFAGQIRVVEADIKSRGAGRNKTFPGTLSLDDVLARLKALEGADQGGALAVKRAAPADDFEGPWAGFFPYTHLMFYLTFCMPVHCGNALATCNGSCVSWPSRQWLCTTGTVAWGSIPTLP